MSLALLQNEVRFPDAVESKKISHEVRIVTATAELVTDRAWGRHTFPTHGAHLLRAFFVRYRGGWGGWGGLEVIRAVEFPDCPPKGLRARVRTALCHTSRSVASAPASGPLCLSPAAWLLVAAARKSSEFLGLEMSNRSGAARTHGLSANQIVRGR